MISFLDHSFVFIVKHFDDILIVSLGLFIFLILQTNQSINVKRDKHGNKDDDTPVVKKEIVIEAMNGNKEINLKQKEEEKEFDDIVNNMSANFCHSLKDSDEKNEKCKIQTDGACKVLDCCVLVKNKGDKKLKCLAGSSVGPTFQTDSNGNQINIDYFYYQNKCNGATCPKE